MDYVSSEGGPILLADAIVAQSWRGIDEDGADYDRACLCFDNDPQLQGVPIQIDESYGILWEMQGGGVAAVFRMPNDSIVIVRSWHNLDDYISVDAELAALPMINPILIGKLAINCGTLSLLWATENGECLGDINVDDHTRPSGDMSVGSAGFLVKVNNGLYTCYHDFVETSSGIGRRLHIKRISER